MRIYSQYWGDCDGYQEAVDSASLFYERANVALSCSAYIKGGATVTLYEGGMVIRNEEGGYSLDISFISLGEEREFKEMLTNLG